MKFYCCILIIFSNYLWASNLHSMGVASYLEYIDHVSNVGVSEIEESPSGAFVYAGTSLSGNDALDIITVYSKDAGNGTLTELYSYTQGTNGVDGLTGINDIKVTNDNSCLFVSSNKLIIPFNEDGHLASFKINSTSGELSFVEAIDRLDPNNGDFIQAKKIVVSDDNNFLYMAVAGDVLVFAIDTIDCQLSFVDKIAVPGSSFIGYGLELDPSNQALYITVGNTGQPNSGGVVQFQRDQITGLLSQTNLYSNGMDGIIDLENPLDLEITEDGRYLYTISYDRGAVVVFDIDQLTGELSFDSSYVNLTNDIEGLIEPRKLEISADQSYLVITGQWENSLVVFERDQVDGTLFYESTYYDDQDGFDFMSGINDILLSNDGYLYTTAWIDDAIQVIETSSVVNDLIFADGFD